MQAVLIIALGESVLVMSLTFTSGGFAARQTAALMVSFGTTVRLWRLYFYRAGERAGAAIAAAPDAGRLGQRASFAHVPIVAGIVVVAVGDELVIAHPGGRMEYTWAALFCAGPALFHAGHALFEYAVFGSASRSRLPGLLLLIAVASAMVLVPPVMAAAVVPVILFVIAVIDMVAERPAAGRRRVHAPGNPVEVALRVFEVVVDEAGQEGPDCIDVVRCQLSSEVLDYPP